MDLYDDDYAVNPRARREFQTSLFTQEFLYVIKKSLIIDEWKKKRYRIEKRENLLSKNNRQHTLGTMMAASFKKHL